MGLVVGDVRVTCWVLVCIELGLVVTGSVTEAELVPAEGLWLLLISIPVTISVSCVVSVELWDVTVENKLVKLAVIVGELVISVTISVSIKQMNTVGIRFVSFYKNKFIKSK